MSRSIPPPATCSRSSSSASFGDGTATEYDASGSSAVELDRIIPEALKRINEAAYGPASEVYTNYGNQIALYGLPKVVPSVTAKPASNVSGTKATLNALVNPQGVEVTECLFEYGTTSFDKTAPCEGSIPTDYKDHAVHANISGLVANGQSYKFRLLAKNENGPESGAEKSFVTAQTVVTEAASEIGDASATLNGLVRPEGLEYTECLFEYGLASHAGYEQSTECVPGATALGADFSPHAVSASLEGLEAGAVYRFRILATNSEGTRVGKELDFETLGPPQISEVRAVDATQDSVTLEAKVNPSGFGTSYRFEWGPTSSYGNQVPSGFEPFIGSGTTPVRVSAQLTGLSAGAAYHYRVVATSDLEGTTTVAGPDQTLETLNSCGLPEGRCLEMASPRELGPIGAAGRQLAVFELHAQAGEQPGALAYTVEGGLPDATRGTQVLYGATRGAEGWSSQQLSPPTIAPSQLIGTSNPSQILALSPDLSCGVLASNQPLTGDPQAKLIVESGGGNLYRRNPDGSYDLITELAPENPEQASGHYTGNYTLDGISDDCSRVAFESNLHYPGVPGSGEDRHYEWSKAEGLRSVGIVPSGGGEEAVAEGVSAGSLNAVSDDGSRLFFSAKRLVGKVGGETGKTGVFVREGGESRDISATQTSTPDNGATYVGATPDGSHAYFTANAGLTAESSESGTDLYEYDLESETLTDLSPVVEGVAEVAGLVGVADDGSHVYFAARAQLVPGRGPNTAQNEAAGTRSIYDASEGDLAYAGVTGLPEATTTALSAWTSRVSPEGRYLLFESRANVTPYDSGGRVEAYLYDAEAAAGAEATVCVSCRQDGKPPLAQSRILISGGQSQELYVARSLVVRGGQPLVFFRSVNPLAPGAQAGESSLYEWAHGQVFHLAAQPASVGPEGVGIGFAGASADGADLYFFDAAPLNWENREERYAAWDARIGGGFAEPPAPSSCDPTSEGEAACRGSGSGSPSSPSAASRDFHGSGNVKEAGGGANNRCAGRARSAQRLSARAKKLRRNARRVNANGHHARAVKLNRKAKGLARRARGQSNKAKRCRKRLRANDNRRAGK